MIVKGDSMKKVLFVCIHNSARSQMAEAFLNLYGKGHFLAESAGLESGVLNQNVVKVMEERNIDISNNQTKTVKMMINNKYEYVITVCDGASKEACPIFPNHPQTLHWDLKDPSSLKGPIEEIMEKIRLIRDEIENRVIKFINEEAE